MTWQTEALWLVQWYWVIWLAGSFLVTMVLGGVIFRNYENAK